MADETYTVKVTTTGDTSGVDKVTDSLNKATAATGEHGKSAKEAGGLVSDLGSRSGTTRHFVEGLEQASRGGTAGILGFARAITSAGHAISPLSLAIGALLALTPTFLEWFEKLSGHEEKAKEDAERTNKALEQQKEIVDELSRAKLEKFTESIKAVADETERALKFTRELSDIAGKLSKSYEDRAIAEIKGNPKLSETEKAVQIEKIQSANRAAARAREDQDAKETFDIRKKARDDTAEILANAQKEKFDAEHVVEEERRRQKDRERVLQEYQRQLEIVQGRRLRAYQNSPEVQEKLNEEEETLKEKIEELEAGRKFDSTQQSQAKQAEAKRRRDDARAAEKTAKQAADKAAQDFEEIARDDGGSRRVIRGNEDAKARADAKEAMRKAMEDDWKAGRVPSADAWREANGFLYGREPGYRPPYQPTPARGPSSMQIGSNIDREAEKAEITRMIAEQQQQKEAIVRALHESGGVIGNAVIKAIRDLQKDVDEKLKAARR